MALNSCFLAAALLLGTLGTWLHTPPSGIGTSPVKPTGIGTSPADGCPLPGHGC